ncbi:Malic enzyme [Frankia canadensis]|uniref:Malic enzyme n=1 Tax=Frankia canadensis TaxID=1836972 RepID=A0A2I2KWG4_9ACTN|nr:malic enzyme-like protein [Frankia canadensis]SNQ49994.1 Malic enzyme [Frankia canadensis]SOU57284.1 Malic enzyme [Frankia canadensis]
MTQANPAYSVTVRVPGTARQVIDAVVAAAPGAITCYADEPDPAGRRITLDADSAATLTWLIHALRSRLGADLLQTEDPVFVVASTGKLTQSLCASVITGHDLALLDADADRRVIRHLASHPTHTDLFTGRPRRVALLTDASAVLDFEPLTAEAALPAVESQAVHLHRATGLDVIPMPIAARDAADLGLAIGMIAPGFAATVLVHTHVSHIDAVRAAPAAAGATPLLDTLNDGLAVAATAAALSHLLARGLPPGRARVVVVDPARGGDLAGLLLAAGIRDLTLYDPLSYGIQPLHQLANELDLVVDLIGLASPPRGAPVLRIRPETPPPLASATSGPRPLHALPGLLRAAVRAHRAVTMAARLAAVRALVDLTPPGGLLPPLDHPRLTPAVAEAATRALAED